MEEDWIVDRARRRALMNKHPRLTPPISRGFNRSSVLISKIWHRRTVKAEVERNPCSMIGRSSRVMSRTRKAFIPP